MKIKNEKRPYVAPRYLARGRNLELRIMGLKNFNTNTNNKNKQKKPSSCVAAGVAHKKTLTAKSHECYA
jgi:hypothetical protein